MMLNRIIHSKRANLVFSCLMILTLLINPLGFSLFARADRSTDSSSLPFAVELLDPTTEVGAALKLMYTPLEDGLTDVRISFPSNLTYLWGTWNSTDQNDSGGIIPNELVIEEPVVDELAIEDPVVDGSAIEDPVVDEPVPVESIADESVVDESIDGEQIANEETSEEAINEESSGGATAEDTIVIDDPLIALASYQDLLASNVGIMTPDSHEISVADWANLSGSCIIMSFRVEEAAETKFSVQGVLNGEIITFEVEAQVVSQTNTSLGLPSDYECTTHLFKWGDNVGLDGDTLNLAPSQNARQAVTAQIDYSFDGLQAALPGEIEIRLPRYIFYNSNGAPANQLVLPSLPTLTQAQLAQASENTSFCYYYDGDDIVITNYKLFEAGTFSCELTYSYLPYQISNNYTKNDIQASFTYRHISGGDNDVDVDITDLSDILTVNVNTTALPDTARGTGKIEYETQVQNATRTDATVTLTNSIEQGRALDLRDEYGNPFDPSAESGGNVGIDKRITSFDTQTGLATIQLTVKGTVNEKSGIGPANVLLLIDESESMFNDNTTAYGSFTSSYQPSTKGDYLANGTPSVIGASPYERIFSFTPSTKATNYKRIQPAKWAAKLFANSIIGSSNNTREQNYVGVIGFARYVFFNGMDTGLTTATDQIKWTGAQPDARNFGTVWKGYQDVFSLLGDNNGLIDMMYHFKSNVATYKEANDSDMSAKDLCIADPPGDYVNQGTNVQGGLLGALEVLNRRPNDNPTYLILLSDGLPVYYYTQEDANPATTGHLKPWNTNKSVLWYQQFRRNTDDGFTATALNSIARKKAIEAANLIKDTGVKIITVGLDLNSPSEKAAADSFLRALSSGDEYCYNINSAELENTVNNIINSLAPVSSGTNAVVEDILGESFNGNPPINITTTGKTTAVYNEQTHTITWEWNDEEIDETVETLTYQIQLNPDAASGLHNTNESATLTYNDPNGQEKLMYFPVPTVYKAVLQCTKQLLAADGTNPSPPDTLFTIRAFVERPISGVGNGFATIGAGETATFEFLSMDENAAYDVDITEDHATDIDGYELIEITSSNVNGVYIDSEKTFKLKGLTQASALAELIIKNAEISTSSVVIKKETYDDTSGIQNRGPSDTFSINLFMVKADGSLMLVPLRGGQATVTAWDPEGLTIEKLPLGDYLVVEDGSKMPDGAYKYGLTSGSSSVFTLSADHASQEVTLVNVTSDQTAEITLKKILRNTENSNAEEIPDNYSFILYDDNGNCVSSVVVNVPNFQTESAVVSLGNVPPGVYTLKEVSLDKSLFGVATFKAGSALSVYTEGTVFSVAENETYYFECENQLTDYGRLIITKEDFSDKTKLSGAEFELTDENGNSFSPRVLSVPTDTQGEYKITNIPLGISMKLKETVAPKGYRLDANVTMPEFIFTSNNLTQNCTVTNTKSEKMNVSYTFQKGVMMVGMTDYNDTNSYNFRTTQQSPLVVPTDEKVYCAVLVRNTGDLPITINAIDDDVFVPLSSTKNTFNNVTTLVDLPLEIKKGASALIPFELGVIPSADYAGMIYKDKVTVYAFPSENGVIDYSSPIQPTDPKDDAYVKPVADPVVVPDAILDIDPGSGGLQLVKLINGVSANTADRAVWVDANSTMTFSVTVKTLNDIPIYGIRVNDLVEGDITRDLSDGSLFTDYNMTVYRAEAGLESADFDGTLYENDVLTFTYTLAAPGSAAMIYHNTATADGYYQDETGGQTPVSAEDDAYAKIQNLYPQSGSDPIEPPANTRQNENPGMPPAPETITVIPDVYIGGERQPLGYNNPRNRGLTAIQSTSNPNEFIIFGEDDVPLGTTVIPDGASIEEIDVIDNLIPLGTAIVPPDIKNNPTTGEVIHMGIYITLLLLVGATTLLATSFRLKKNRR